MSEGSIERIFAILDLFTEERLEWSPDDLMRRLGYSRPTLYRYLRYLREAGFLTSLPGAGLTLGPRVTELDFLMRKSDPLIREGQAEIDALAARHPASALLVRWYGQKLLCVASVTTAPAPKSSYPRGRPMPLGRGAISRAILANLPRRRQRALIADHLDDLAEIGQGETEDDVLASLRRVRRDGVATAQGEVTPGVIGIAAPVFDAGHSPIAALCLTSTDSYASGLIDRLSREVRDAAQGLSVRLSRTRDAAPLSDPIH